MPNLGQLFAGIDNAKRVARRNLSDLIENPVDYLDQTGDNAAQTIRDMVNDPASYVGRGFYGIGRTDILNAAGKKIGAAPTQASLAGNLHSMGIIDDMGAHRLYNMRGATPELLELIERDVASRGRLKNLAR